MTALVLSLDGTRVRVSDGDNLKRWLLEPKREAIAVDTETDGLAWGARVRLVQFGADDGGFAVDVTNLAGRALVKEALMAFKGTLIFHNAPFDIHALEVLGLNPDYLWPRAIDTYVMAHVLAPSDPHGLDDLAKHYLKVDDKEWKAEFKQFMRGQVVEVDKDGKEHLRKRRKVWSWGTVPRLRLAPYGITDAVNTYRLWKHLGSLLTPVEWDVVMQEMEAEVAVYEVQGHGLLLDKEYARALKEKWEYELGEDVLWFNGQGIKNPNSNRQVAHVLQEAGWVPEVRTPSGEVKLDKAVLKELAADGNQIAVRLREYKRKTKWLAAYVENCLEEADSEGYVHARYNTLGARTGRMSCSNPPLQQLPKGSADGDSFERAVHAVGPAPGELGYKPLGSGVVRRLFIASPGNVIASVDYSAIELRLAGAISGDQRIIDAYARGSDLYQETADALGITRAEAKVVVLASLYGWGGETSKTGLSAAEGKAQVNQFWATYPQLSRWNISVTNKAKGGRVQSGWGRTLAPHAPFAAGNAVIQGTAAEILKEGLLRLGEKGLLRYVAALVHDEVVLDVPEAEAQSITDQVVETLRDDNYAIPIVAEGEVYGRSWGDGYTD